MPRWAGQGAGDSLHSVRPWSPDHGPGWLELQSENAYQEGWGAFPVRLPLGNRASLSKAAVSMLLRWAIPLIVVGLLAWGIFHAYGAYTLNHNIWRPVMVIGCVLAFLAFWGLMLASRRARLRRQDGPQHRRLGPRDAC